MTYTRSLLARSLPLLLFFAVIACAHADSGQTMTFPGGNTLLVSDVGVHNLYNDNLPTRIEGHIKNTSAFTAESVIAEVTFYEADGSKIATSSDSTTNLSPGETWRFQVDVVEGTHNYKVSRVLASFTAPTTPAVPTVAAPRISPTFDPFSDLSSDLKDSLNLLVAQLEIKDYASAITTLDTLKASLQKSKADDDAKNALYVFTMKDGSKFYGKVLADTSVTDGEFKIGLDTPGNPTRTLKLVDVVSKTVVASEADAKATGATP